MAQKKAGPKGKSPNVRRRPAATSTSQSLVLVDAWPLRKRLWQQYLRAVKAFELASQDLRVFKETDSERYRLWCETEFSEQITELRRTQAAVTELAEWVEQVKTYADYREIPVDVALQILTEARDEGRIDALWHDVVKEIEAEDARQAAEANKEPQKDKRQSWSDLEDVVGEAFEAAAEGFHEQDDDQPSGASEARERGKHREKERDRDKGKLKSKSEATQKMERSLREIFHQLAFRLHPDTNPQQTDNERQLFHDAQEAYRSQDLETLEAIWQKLEGSQEGPFSWQTAPISEIMRRKKVIDHRKRDLGTEIKYAKQHPGWQFSKVLTNKSAITILKAKVGKALSLELDEASQHWLHLNEWLTRIGRTMRNKKTKTRRRPRE